MTQAERAKGYTPWKGQRTAGASRWWVIAKGNLGLAWSNRWTKIIALLALAPGVVSAGLIYFVIPLSNAILAGLLRTSVYFVFLIGALVGARLISEDRRQGAFVAHFSRPVRRADYLLGKVVALALPVFLVATVPSLLAIAADAAVDNETLADRLTAQAGGAPVPDPQGYLAHVAPSAALGTVLLYGLIAAAGTTGIVLGLSALTTSARSAGLAWFGVVALGGAGASILGAATGEAWPALFSWIDGLSDVGSRLAGQTGPDLEFSLQARALVLVVASALGVVFVDWRLRRAEGGERA